MGLWFKIKKWRACQKSCHHLAKLIQSKEMLR